MDWRRWNRGALFGRGNRWGRIGLILVLAMVLLLIYHRASHRQAWFEEGGPLAPDRLERDGGGEPGTGQGTK